MTVVRDLFKMPVTRYNLPIKTKCSSRYYLIKVSHRTSLIQKGSRQIAECMINIIAERYLLKCCQYF